MIKPFVVCGKLEFYDTFEIDGKVLEELIFAHFNKQVTDEPRDIGEVRITIEKLKEEI